MDKIILFTTPILLAIPTAVLLCRARIARKLRVSFGTVFFTAFVVTFFWLGLVTQGEIYTISFWRGFQPKPPDRELALKAVVFILITSALPALGVVHHYQKRAK